MPGDLALKPHDTRRGRLLRPVGLLTGIDAALRPVEAALPIESEASIDSERSDRPAQLDIGIEVGESDPNRLDKVHISLVKSDSHNVHPFIWNVHCPDSIVKRDNSTVKLDFITVNFDFATVKYANAVVKFNNSTVNSDDVSVKYDI